MTVRSDMLTLLACVLLPLTVHGSDPVAGSQNRDQTADDAVTIGDTIPSLSFKDIRYLPRTLDELGPHQAFVFVFTNTTCPLVQRYMPRLKSLDAKYGEQNVQFVAVNVGRHDSIRDMAAHALEYDIPFPFVKDESGQCAAALGVTRTPEVAVLDAQHRLVYRGRIDDQYRLGGALPKPRRHDLEEAIKDVLAGEAVSEAQTPVDGCLITVNEIQTPVPTELTFGKDIAPLIHQHCAVCHRKGTAAPFSLVSWQDVSSHGKMIEEVVAEQRMPPWYAGSQHGTFQNDRSLSRKDRDTILEWIRGGMPEGSPTKPDEALLEPASRWQAGEPDLVLTMPIPHVIPAEGFVPYQYTVLPHLFLKDTWLESIEILPHNRRVVHHANLAYANPQEKAGHDTFITGYVPGGQPMDLRPFDNGVAFRVPALSVLGLQIHYVTTGKPEQCTLSVGLRFSRNVVRKRLRHHLLDPRRFRIPPGHPAWAVKGSVTLKQDITLLGLFTHMHLRGKDMTFLAHSPNDATETLLQIPNFNFDWQHAFEIEAGKKRLLKGTRVEAIAHYDNSTFNPYNPDPKATVGYGLQTVDEMMNGYFFFTVDSETLAINVDPETGYESSQ